MYESKKRAPLSRPAFARRLGLHLVLVLALLLLSLGLGMAGYHHFEHMPWIDSFVNAAMLLGGMGPVNALHSDAGKLFAGLYALYAGLVFIVSAAMIFTPLLHRVMHRLHWDTDD